MSASIATCALGIGLPEASDNLNATVSVPTRAGSGETSCSIATKGVCSTALEQLPTSRVAPQARPTSHFAGLGFEKKSDTRRSGSLRRIVAAPLARAGHVPLLARGREHVVIHADHHGDEHDRIIEKVQLNPREDQLQDAAGHRLAPEIVMKRGLPDQQKMFNVMPELNPKGNHPPGVRNSGKALAKHPQADQHHQGVAVVQSFGLNQPRVPQPDKAICPRPRPSHDINLISLEKMFTPVRQHYKHKDLQTALVPARIELVGEAGVGPWLKMNIWNCMRYRHYGPPQKTNLKMRPRSHLCDQGVNNRIVLRANDSSSLGFRSGT